MGTSLCLPGGPDGSARAAAPCLPVLPSLPPCTWSPERRQVAASAGVSCSRGGKEPSARFRPRLPADLSPRRLPVPADASCPGDPSFRVGLPSASSRPGRRLVCGLPRQSGGCASAGGTVWGHQLSGKIKSGAAGAFSSGCFQIHGCFCFALFFLLKVSLACNQKRTFDTYTSMCPKASRDVGAGTEESPPAGLDGASGPLTAR